MITKIMTCTVTDPPAFDRGQRSWSALATVDGFEAQCGGWDAIHGNRVWLFARWRDADAYATFMHTVHDDIHDASEQARSYTNLTTTIARPLERLNDQNVPGDAVRSAGHIRLADCRTRSDRRPHFIEVQQTIWNPGMRAAGAIAVWPVVDRNDPNHIMVISLWPDAEAHERYRGDAFPALRGQAQPDSDLESLHGWSVTVEPPWTVCQS